MTNQTRSAVHDAATKAETLAYNLANASSLASVLSVVLDKELGSTIEGQSFAAPITLLDKLKEDGKGLERRAVRRIATCTAEPPTRPHRRVRAHTEEGGVWPRSK